jgi:hypothetical protein
MRLHPTIELQVSEPPGGLFDEPFVLRARPERIAPLTWRARYRDDDARVWRASAPTAAELTDAWQASKASTTGYAALQSLRPVSVDVRVEGPDGQAASRSLTRRLLGEGVRRRRWREGLTATLHLPAEEPLGVVLLDATAEADAGAAAMLAAPLLASRGVLTLAVTKGPVDAALERLAAMPVVALEPVVLTGAPLPPNVGASEGEPPDRAAVWDALLARVGARPRATPTGTR